MNQKLGAESEVPEKEVWIKPNLKKMDIEETANGIVGGFDGKDQGS